MGPPDFGSRHTAFFQPEGAGNEMILCVKGPCLLRNPQVQTSAVGRHGTTESCERTGASEMTTIRGESNGKENGKKKRNLLSWV